MEEKGEITVEEHEHPRRIMKLAKTFLLNRDSLNIIAGTNSSPIATKAAETLTRYGYVTIENIKTLTEVRNDKRFIKLIITIKKTPDFKKIYDENEADTKRKAEEKEKLAKEKTKDGK